MPKIEEIKKGERVNWLIIPGGPGLSPQYLSSIFSSIGLEGSIHSLTFDHFNDYKSDEEVIPLAQNKIQRFIDETENVILLGHSFGGMFLQCLNLNNYLNIILLCSSPDTKCFEQALINYEHFSSTEKELIEDAQMIYEKHKNNETFKNLFLAWRPYYEPRVHGELYASMISECTFDWQFYEWGNRYFHSYFSINGKIPDHALIVNSKNDKICPSSLFNAVDEIIEGSSHFPWLESKTQFSNLMKKIEVEILKESFY